VHIPLEFEANRGQAPSYFGFVAHGPNYSLGLAPSEIALSLRGFSGTNPAELLTSSASRERQSEAIQLSQLRLRLLGADKDAVLEGLDPEPGVSNYFIGNDPARWHTGVPHFGRVRVAKAYPGVDLVLYGNPRQLEYDFQVAPGADPNVIRVDAEGAQTTSLDGNGNLVLGTAAGDVQLNRPEAYQVIDGKRRPVKSEFQLLAGNVVQFRMGKYDRSKPLVIDPVLLYAISIGGSNGNSGLAIDADSAGNAYVTGNTSSVDFPSTAGSFGALQTSPSGKSYDTFVVKVNPTASTLLYSDYISGSSSEAGTSIAVDSSGDAFVGGLTTSASFPLVNNIGPSAPPATCDLTSDGFSCPDAFILKLSPDGSTLLFSSLLGGSQASSTFNVKLDSVTGDLLVLGVTNSSNFQPAPTTLESTYQGGTCSGGLPCFVGFLLGLNPATGAYRYGTYLSGTNNTLLTGLAVGSTGDVYVSGSATRPMSSSLGGVTSAYPPSGGLSAGGSNIMVARLHPASGVLSKVYLTFVQGEADDTAIAVAVDGSQNAYFAGASGSLHLPVTAGALQTSTVKKPGYSCGVPSLFAQVVPKECGTGVVGKLSPTGTLSFLTYLGGTTGQDYAQAIGVDSLNNLWISGLAGSTDFPFSSDSYSVNGTVTGISQGSPFLAEMSSNGATLPFASLTATVLGEATGLKIDSSNNVYVTGFATYMLASPNVYPPYPAVFNPVFIQKWSSGPQPAVQLSSTSLTFPPTAYGGTSAPQTVTLENTGAGTMELSIQLITSTYNLTLPPGYLESDNCGVSLAPGVSCTITVTFQPMSSPPGCVYANGCNPFGPSGEVLIQTNAAVGTSTISLAGTTGHGAAVAVVPNPIVFGPQAAGTTSAGTYVEIDSEGDLPLIVSGLSIAGPNAADFQITSNGCTAPVPIGEIGCTVYLAFSPAVAATGTRTASLVVTDNAGDSPQAVPMSGIVPGPGASLIVTPGPLYLGLAAIGAASSSSVANVTVTNASTNTSVQVTSLTIAGANTADFSVANGSCSSGSLPFAVAPGATCFLQVTFLPSSGTHGLRTATFTLATNPAIPGLPVIALSGDAVTNSDSSLNLISVPMPQDFGSVQVGQSSYPEQNLIAISALYPIPCANGASTCGGPLTISSFATGLPDYTVVSLNSEGYCTNPPLTIPAGNYGCTFEIVFSPTAAGARNTTLSINSNDPMGPTVIPLFGSGIALPIGNLSITQLNFGNSAIGVTSLPMSFTLQNTGQMNLSVSSVNASGPFSIAADNCPASLAPNALCTIAVSFSPPSAGPFTGSVTITDNDYYGSQQTVALSGTGATGPYLRVTPTSIYFGNQGLNTASPAQTVTLANTGDTTITFPANAWHTGGDYPIQDTTCGSSLAPSTTCVINLQFKPSVSYPDPGILLITDNASGSPQAVDLTGVGTTTADGTPTITLTSSPNPSAIGVPVILSATVSPPAGNLPTPTGTVTFYSVFSLLGTGTLNSHGQASASTSVLPTGTQYINAQYNGDNNYTSATSAVLDQVVNQASNNTTTTALVSSVNPSTFGQTVVLTATVTGGGGPAPAGNVMFVDGTTPIGTVALNGASEALLETPSLSVGSHSISAMYAGSGVYSASTSSSLNQNVNSGTGTATTTSLATSANPASAGQPVVFTATVSGVGGTPTGTVTFLSGTTVLGTTLLNGAGQASLQVGALAAGLYSVAAVYGGATTYAGSSSTTLTETATSPPYIWLANGSQTLSKFGVSGLAFSPPGGYSGGGYGAAVDGAGNIWSGGLGNVTVLNRFGGGAQTFSGGGIATPASIAIAGDGSVWIANTNSTISTLANNGVATSPTTGYSGGGMALPTAISIDGSGNVWVTNTGDSSLTEFVGAAAPVVTPLAAAVKNNNQGGQP